MYQTADSAQGCGERQYRASSISVRYVAGEDQPDELTDVIYRAHKSEFPSIGVTGDVPLALNRILGWIVDPRIAPFGNVTESFVCARPCVILHDITDAFGRLGYIRDGINHPRHVELRVR